MGQCALFVTHHFSQQSCCIVEMKILELYISLSLVAMFMAVSNQEATVAELSLSFLVITLYWVKNQKVLTSDNILNTISEFMSSIGPFDPHCMLEMTRVRLDFNTVPVLLQVLGGRCGCDAVGSKKRLEFSTGDNGQERLVRTRRKLSNSLSIGQSVISEVVIDFEEPESETICTNYCFLSKKIGGLKPSFFRGTRCFDSYILSTPDFYNYVIFMVMKVKPENRTLVTGNCVGVSSIQIAYFAC